MSVKVVGEKTIRITRREIDFDRACEEAVDRALDEFEVDDDGQVHKYPDIHRSSCSIGIDFINYAMILGMSGREAVYAFKIMIIVREDDEEDEEE